MKKIFLLIAVSLIMAACDKNNDNPLNSQTAAHVTASIGKNTLSRASDTSWTTDDKIGISSTVGSIVGPYINLQYTTVNGDGFFVGTPLYFYKPMTLTAYYPFTGKEGIDPGIINANTGVANQTTENQPFIDFLWDCRTGEDQKDFSATNPNVDFKFAHKMSKLTFAFKGSKEVIEDGTVIAKEVKVSDMVSYEIEGLVMDGSFDTATGICAIDGSVQPRNLKIDVTKGSVEDEKSLSPLIVFPQKPGNSKVKLHVYTDELDNPGYLQHYVCMLTFGDGELKPGNSYKYTIQISKVGLKLEKMTIVDWNTEREVNLTATIDGGIKKDENN